MCSEGLAKVLMQYRTTILAARRYTLQVTMGNGYGETRDNVEGVDAARTGAH